MIYTLPDRLPRDDKAAIRKVLRSLKSVGYRAHEIFDEDQATYVGLPVNESLIVNEITGVDDATVLFTGQRGDSFYVRFVMGNDPQEVVCDHSWRDMQGDPGWEAFDALNQLSDRWSELEAAAL